MLPGRGISSLAISRNTCNYTIFACGDELFGYYECVHGAAFAQKAQDESPVVARWCEMMSDIQVLSTEADTLEQVFRLD